MTFATTMNDSDPRKEPTTDGWTGPRTTENYGARGTNQGNRVNRRIDECSEPHTTYPFMGPNVKLSGDHARSVDGSTRAALRVGVRSNAALGQA